MSSCCSSFFSANQRQFSDAVARRDLARYRRRGPDQTTRLLRDAIVGAGQGKTVLDVGAGIGALSFELLAAGAERATVGTCERRSRSRIWDAPCFAIRIVASCTLREGWTPCLFDRASRGYSIRRR